MTNRLEELKRDAREKFIDVIPEGPDAGGEYVLYHNPELMEKALEELVTHIYTQAIQDAIGTVRKEELVGTITKTDIDSDETIEAPSEIRSAYNAALEYAAEALKALLPQQ